jgi:hypothetical protein
MLYVKKITEFNEFLKIKNIWNRLLVESEIDNPYLTHDWFRIAYQYFEKKSELFILLAYEKTEVIAIAPFLISRDKMYGLSLKKLRFLENVHTPFQDFIITKRSRESLKTIVDFLQKNVKLWDLMELKEIRNNSEHIKILLKLCETNNNFYYQFLLSRDWTVFTNLPWGEILAKMKTKFKRNLRRRIRKLEERGILSFNSVYDIRSIEKHLDHFFSIHAETWKGKEQNSQFYYKIAKEFSKNNKFVMYILCLDERPISYMFGLKYNSGLFGIKTTYDPSYSAFSPGTIMFYKIVKECSSDSAINKFDIGRGNERYKQDLTCRPTDQLILIAGHKKTIPSYVYNVRFKIVLYIKKKMKLIDSLSLSKKSNVSIKYFFKQKLLSKRSS